MRSTSTFFHRSAVNVFCSFYHKHNFCLTLAKRFSRLIVWKISLLTFFHQELAKKFDSTLISVTVAEGWLQSAVPSGSVLLQDPEVEEKIVADPSHLRHKLFETLQSIRTKTSRHKNSFFPSAAGLVNKLDAFNPRGWYLVIPPELCLKCFNFFFTSFAKRKKRSWVVHTFLLSAPFLWHNETDNLSLERHVKLTVICNVFVISLCRLLQSCPAHSSSNIKLAHLPAVSSVPFIWLFWLENHWDDTSYSFFF